MVSNEDKNLEHPIGQMNSFSFERNQRRFSNRIQKCPTGEIISHAVDSPLYRIPMHSNPKNDLRENNENFTGIIN